MKELKLATLLANLDVCMIQARDSMFGHKIEIRYGNPLIPGTDAIVLRWMKTAGGMQWGVRSINRLGQEGSGHYLPDADRMAMKDYVMQLVVEHHKPLPAIIRGNIEGRLKEMPALEFYMHQPNAQFTQHTADVERMMDTDDEIFGKDVTTIDLK